MVKESEFVYKVCKTKLGKFTLECDSIFLKERGYKKFLDAFGVSISKRNQDKFDKTLAINSDLLIPYEIVTPPIPLSQMSELNKLKETIHREIIKSDNLTFAPRGLHINPEVFSVEPGSILNILRAFCLSFNQLVQEKKIDITRRLSPYIKPFPTNYVNLITKSDYRPKLKTLVHDYLSYSPTRNRALDLTPLFAFIDEDLILGYKGLEYSLIKSRPTFHYRLSNCEIQNESWHIANEWNSWVQIESLALDEERLAQAMKDYQKKLKLNLELK